MPKFIDLTGQKFSRLTVIKRAPNHGKETMWECQCDCSFNKIVVVNAAALKSGNTKSCGCYNSEKTIALNKLRKTHGDTKTRLYSIWRHMKERCQKDYNTNSKSYKGRGITVCQEWENYETFKEWAINNGYFENLSIDKINNDLGYFPDNCRWTDSITQANNKRTNHLITINGETKTAKEWERYSGINSKTILYRLKLGWKDDELLSAPYRLRGMI